MYIQGNNKKFVFLEPGRTSKVFWSINVNNSLDKNGLYRFPIHIFLRNNISSTSSFNVSKNWPVYSESYVNQILDEQKDSVLSEQTKFTEVECDIPKVIMINEESSMECEITNRDNKQVNNLEICFQNNCQTISIGSEATKKINVPILFNTLGIQTTVLNIDNDLISKKEYLNFNVIDIPSIKIATSIPETTTFNEDFLLSMEITIKSNSRPKNMNVSIKGPGGIDKTWDFDSLDIDQIINLEISSKRLYKDNNEFIIDFNWKDELGRTYTEQRKLNVQLIDLNLWQNFYVFVNKLING
jgi:hypothetical protein